jgi:hypothetical protein
MGSRFRAWAGVRFAVVAVVLGPVGLGCGPGERPVAVRGKVTFQGRPVTEGTVQFNDARTGRGAEAELGPGGSYKATLPPGDYAVIILPPLLFVESRSGPPDPRFKKVRNVPEKYRSTATSDLTAAVSADRAVHDFDMKP